MSSIQKQNAPFPGNSSDTFLSSFELELSSLKNIGEVELLMKKLQFLGLNYDPFGPEMSDECRQVMDHLGLTHEFKNPYQATNILLRLLDKTEEHLNNLKQ